MVILHNQSPDPCLYIMRFANKLEFGEKAHEVSMTAQRLVQRMMKDSIHSGRRPSGLCGAALLIAARMHEYNRTPMDIVRIVKIHESTLRKRLIEFGDTPSSLLTLEEFMAVDLEAEQDPPAFKAARKKDRERLQKIADAAAEFSELQQQIDSHLDRDTKRSGKKRKASGAPVAAEAMGGGGDSSTPSGTDYEGDETDVFIRESTMDVINECLGDEGRRQPTASDVADVVTELRPDIAAMCVPSTRAIDEQAATAAFRQATGGSSAAGSSSAEAVSEELHLSDLDDEEINGYIMTENEAKYKLDMWKKLNAEYLAELQQREERLAKEKEEGKPEKKKRRAPRKRHIGPSNTAGEAIEKMLQEKKISNKINYDILKALTEPKTASVDASALEGDAAAAIAAVDEEEVDTKWPVGLGLRRFEHNTLLDERTGLINTLVSILFSVKTENGSSAGRANKPKPRAGLSVVNMEDVKPILAAAAAAAATSNAVLDEHGKLLLVIGESDFDGKLMLLLFFIYTMHR